ncbi:MAG: crossover junction endodeoxyribonuclease RuvC [Bacteroidetes bacterium]|nr:crossover junction endodeoxyribonuclease RuvC [Bacteroidota bacterium]
MIVLGIDPGSHATGFGVIEVLQSEERLLDFGVIKLRPDESHQLRLKTIYSDLCQLIGLYLPDTCAVEMPVYGKNAQSMLKLGRAQAAAMLAALNHEIPVTEYTPKEVKKAVTGNGNASKEQVQYMVRSILAVDESIKMRHDASDALAVGLCHAQRNRTPQQKRYRDWKSFLKENPDRIG